MPSLAFLLETFLLDIYCSLLKSTVLLCVHSSIIVDYNNLYPMSKLSNSTHIS